MDAGRRRFTIVDTARRLHRCPTERSSVDVAGPDTTAHRANAPNGTLHTALRFATGVAVHNASHSCPGRGSNPHLPKKRGFKTASSCVSGALQSFQCAVVCGSSPCSLWSPLQ